MELGITAMISFAAARAMRLLLWIWVPAILLVSAGALAELTLEERSEDWRNRLEAAQQTIAHDFRERSPSEVMAELRTLQQEAQAARRTAQGSLDEVRRTLDRLGPAPAEGEPEEAQPLRDLRRQLEESASRHSAWVRIADATMAQSSDLQEQVAGWEQRRLRGELRERLPTPARPDVWRQAAIDALAFATRLGEAPRDWWDEHREKGDATFGVALVALVALVGLLVGWPLRRLILAGFGRDPSDPSPSYARRIVGAVADGVANAIVPVAIVGLGVLVLTAQGLLTGLMAVLVYVTTLALAGYLVLFGLSRAAFSPQYVAWRIVPVDPGRVSVLLRAFRIGALFLVAGSAGFVLMIYTGSRTAELESVYLLLVTVLVALAGIWALSPRYWIASVERSQEGDGNGVDGTEPFDGDPGTAAETAAEKPDRRPLLDILRSLLRLAVTLAPFLALMGYSRLAYFSQSRLLATAAIIGGGLLLRLAVREFIQQFYLSQSTRRHDAPQAQRSTQGMIFWTELVVDLLIVIPLIYVLLLLYGVPPTTLVLWTQNLFSGIEIGGFTLSPGNLVIAILILSAGLVVTNLFRRWLTDRVLPNTRLEFGARNSVAAGTTYLGVGLSLLIAMGALGLDFTNLALVVGALSLGIGFGLRNVVENFVAGLLLLIERPIKVGDWIIVGEHEGTVRHISVRSTEIETFDRASVIVPNADLISSSVTNWTHKNRMARERIPVGVAYGSDTDNVARTLLRCAETHPKVLSYPPPVVLFVRFGDSSLDFELRCFIGDTNDFMSVRSELHFAIERALRAEGIAIPFPQRDVHIHQPDTPSDGQPDAGSDPAPPG